MRNLLSSPILSDFSESALFTLQEIVFRFVHQNFQTNACLIVNRCVMRNLDIIMYSIHNSPSDPPVAKIFTSLTTTGFYNECAIGPVYSSKNPSQIFAPESCFQTSPFLEGSRAPCRSRNLCMTLAALKGLPSQKTRFHFFDSSIVLSNDSEKGPSFLRSFQEFFQN